MIILPSAAKNARKQERVIRPARAPRTIRKSYERALEDQVRYLKAQTANLSDILKAGVDRQQVARTLSSMAAAAQRRAEATALGMASAFVTDLEKQNKLALERSIASAFSVDFASVLDGPDIAANLQMAIAENVDLIKSISQQHFAEVGQAVLDNYRGVPLPGDVSLTQRLQKIGGISKNRAKFIARDQTGKLTADLNQMRQADNGIEEYIWRNAGDNRVVGNPGGLYPKGNRVHGNHWDREGKKFRWDSPPHDGNPGHAPNCFPGSTIFDLSNGCDKLWRRNYIGPLVSVISSDGAALHATPNHPILTGDGWKAINLLEQCDDVIKPVAYGCDIVESDVNELGASIEQVFDFMASAIPLSSSRGSEFDFHQDGSESDVDTVFSEGFLSSDFVSRFLERTEKLGFSRACVDVDMSALDPSGAHKSAIVWVLRSAYRSMRARRKGESFLGAELAHPDQAGLAARSPWDEVLLKYSGDHSARNAEFICKRKLANPGSVKVADVALWKIGEFVVCRVANSSGSIDSPGAEFFAEVVRVAPEADAYFFESDAGLYQRFGVVEKRSCEFSGHVYNIQTETGWYSANGVVSHNCRCYAAPVLDLEKIKAKYT